MDDDRIWDLEQSLWTADAAHYHRMIDDACLMVIPAQPFIVTGQQAADTVAATPRWTEVAFGNQQVSRPQDGLIVIAYQVRASRAGVDPYSAHCSSTYRRLAQDEWRVVQHQQTPVIGVAAPARAGPVSPAD